MCENCKEIWKAQKPEHIALWDRYAAKMDALAKEMAKDMLDAGIFTIDNSTLNGDELKFAQDSHDEHAASLAISFMAGYYSLSKYHIANYAYEAQELYRSGKQIGWSKSYMDTLPKTLN